MQTDKLAVHLIPYNAIGGVETAARSMLDVSEGSLHFSVRYLHPRRPSGGVNGFFQSILAQRSVACGLIRERPVLLIVSLWRCLLTGCVVKLFRPKTHLVLMLHFPRDVHFVDFLLTRMASLMACEIWADSTATIQTRLGTKKRNTRVISFVTERKQATGKGTFAPVFVFWGRLHRQKNLSLAIRFFAAFRARCNAAKFLVIGPDSGDQPHLTQLCEGLALGDSVDFFGGKSREEIDDFAGQASFYLQTSSLEGMAMSVVEAMQSGLVPVVTPVGEIIHYCKHGENAIFLHDIEHTVAEVLRLLAEPDRYQAMRSNAISTWQQVPTYRESMLKACRSVLSLRS